jgi:uncharacterized protein
VSATIDHNADTGVFSTRVDGQVAQLSYRRQQNRLSIDHTHVPQAIAGRGIAGDLVRTALDYARAERLHVVPACSFAASFIQRHPQYADLVDA